MLFSEPKIPQPMLVQRRSRFLDMVSVLFSEPKIPQPYHDTAQEIRTCYVSVLFSEPKIPQPTIVAAFARLSCGFSALQRAENSSTGLAVFDVLRTPSFQCSSASRKFLNGARRRVRAGNTSVSVLFSEPKIPQHPALLRRSAPNAVSVLFSEPKIPQLKKYRSEPRWKRSFSALQRAENSSTVQPRRPAPVAVRFQCSSASRKFLNASFVPTNAARLLRFSALQRAENSSTIKRYDGVR